MSRTEPEAAASPGGAPRDPGLAAAIERVFRQERTAILATLIRQCGDFTLAEDSVQDAFIRALDVWKRTGIPDRPGAWITTAARRRAIDRIRRDETFERKRKALVDLERAEAATASAAASAAASGTNGPGENVFADDQLRLVFTCCHPALSPEARVALTLRTVSGLTTREIARAFLVTETTMAQRIVRAKRKIRDARIPYRIPSREQLPERVAAVLAVLYLVFNEGYASTESEELVRTELCGEAIRLARWLQRLMPMDAEVQGLLALMLLHDARAPARTGPRGGLVPLEEQDRKRWKTEQIREGLEVLDRAMECRAPGPYQLQAAVAALHVQAETPEDTDWWQIACLYDELLRWQPTPVVALNRAVAVAMADGPSAGLAELDALMEEESLSGYHLFHAARADLLRRAGAWDEAAASYRVALDLCESPVERRYLEGRLDEVTGRDTSGPVP